MSPQVQTSPNLERSKWLPVEILGLAILIASALLLIFNPQSPGGLLDAMIQRVVSTVIPLFITGHVGMAIIVSVIIGRILERCGLTDALIRVFVPIVGKIGVNPAVVVPGVYNILGDINAAGRIAGPTLKEAGATKDEQKIAVATMVNSQQSFATFVLGLIALTAAGISPFMVILLSVFLPLVVVPFILRHTIYRDCKKVSLEQLPRFTPTKGALDTIFSASREGAELLFLLIIPAVTVLFSLIGALDYLGLWQSIELVANGLMNFLSIDPQTGVMSLLIGGTPAMGTLMQTAASIPPKWVVGSFVLASSGMPLSLIFGQLPVVWRQVSDLSERETLSAALVGMLIRLFSAWGLAVLFGLFYP
jgi:hypothetical protein